MRERKWVSKKDMLDKFPEKEESTMERKEPKFAFVKKIGVNQCSYGNTPQLLDAIARLLCCMKESNKINGLEGEFFRLDFRQPYFDEEMQFPRDSLILDLKFGSKKEFEEKNALRPDTQI